MLSGKPEVAAPAANLAVPPSNRFGLSCWRIVGCCQRLLNPGGQLTVIGTPANDTIALQQAADPSLTEAVVNGVRFDFPTSSITSTFIFGLSGSDTITISYSGKSGAPVTVNAGLDNDTINVGTGNLDNIAGAVTVNAAPRR